MPAADEKTLQTRLNVAGPLQRRCQECLSPLDPMKQSKAWSGCAMPATGESVDKKAAPPEAFGAEGERFRLHLARDFQHASPAQRLLDRKRSPCSYDMATHEVARVRGAESVRNVCRCGSIRQTAEQHRGQAVRCDRYEAAPVRRDYSGLVLLLCLIERTNAIGNRSARGQDQMPHYRARSRARPTVSSAAKGRDQHHQGRYRRTRHRAVQYRGAIKRRRYFLHSYAERRRTVERSAGGSSARWNCWRRAYNAGQVRCQKARDQG